VCVGGGGDSNVHVLAGINENIRCARNCDMSYKDARVASPVHVPYLCCFHAYLLFLQLFVTVTIASTTKKVIIELKT
jgi:hypothetical protein